MLKPFAFSWAPILALCATGCGPAGDTVTLQGSGATFPAPLYKRWFLEFYKADREVRVNYQAIGSGAGVRQFTENLTHIGASDAPMKDDEIAKIESGMIQVPMTAGSIALCYHLPTVPHATPIRLSRDVLIRFLLGTEWEDDFKPRKITHWDDPLLRKLNPDVKLPHLPITWVRRSDGSGTTYAFTSHLAAISPEWKKTVGANKSVPWPHGIGGKGNSGVAALVEQTPGALGYVEFGFAELSRLPTIHLENKAGHFIAPTRESNRLALKGAQVPKDFRIAVPDPAGPGAYPIVTYTWMMLRTQYADERTADAVRRLVEYCLTEGQKRSDELGYIPLPEDVVERARLALRTIRP